MSTLIPPTPTKGGEDRTQQSSRPTRLDFGVAIICALPLEADAAGALFDKHWDDYDAFSGNAPRDTNVYSVGIIGRHNVVLVHLSSMGKVEASAAAARCRSSFPNIELALVVGVCGVTPYTPEGEEIVLGDVIISNGVIQYDIGRQFPAHFKRKDTLSDSLGRPNVEIRSLLAKLRVLRMREALSIKAGRYLQLLQRHPMLLARYPGIEYDRLFDPAYQHMSEADTYDQVGCSGELLTRHRLQQAFEHQPIAHFGLIRSGDTVMKSGEARDVIAKQEGVIAFEMEGAGVWDFFPCVVIKGACDYADSHKSKQWQRYAAAVAAAYMKALLDYWNPFPRTVWCPSSDRTETLLCIGQTLSERLNPVIESQRKLHDSLGHVENQIASNMRDFGMSISRTVLAAEDPHNLGHIVRAELKRHLTPFSDNFGRVLELIDRTANSVSKQAHDQDIFQPSNQATLRTSGPPDRVMTSPQEKPIMHRSSVVLSESSERAQPKPEPVDLFSTFHYIKTIIGILTIKVTSYRIRNNISRHQEKYFRLTIRLIPRQRLCLHGLSIAYSSGPDNTGHYEIFPRIQLFSVIPDSSPFYAIVGRDDLGSFVRMLQDRKLSLRDRTSCDWNVLQQSIFLQATSITRYLLHDSGDTGLIDECVDNIPYANMASCFFNSPGGVDDFSSQEQLIALVQEFIYPPDHRSIEWTLCWHNFYNPSFYDNTLCQASELARVLLRYGATFQPFNWAGNTRMCKNEYLLKLFLESGGNPNVRDENGQSPLLKAIFVIAAFLEGELSEILDGDCVRNACFDEWNADIEDPQRCTSLLKLLISAGADIFELLFFESTTTLGDLTVELGISELWEEALEQCGMHVGDVYAESKRRQWQFQRLQGAERTGVDVRMLHEQDLTAGLRYRGRSKNLDL